MGLSFVTPIQLGQTLGRTRPQQRRGNHGPASASLLVILAFLPLLIIEPRHSVRADALTDFAATGADDASADLAAIYAEAATGGATTALATLQDLATKGNVHALAALGEFNLADATDKKRQAAGLTQLERAAEAHSSRAAATLAFHFLYETGPDQDLARALQYAQQAADAGRADGFFALGQIASGRFGGEPDLNLAARQMMKAADLGDVEAPHALAQDFHEGYGVVKNDIVAYAWATIATARDKDASDRTKLQDSLGLLLLPDEILEGQHLAATWKAGDNLFARLTTDQVTAASLLPGPEPIISTPGPIFGADRPRAKPADIGIVERQMIGDAKINADGSRTSTWHFEFEARNEASLKDIGQIPLTFDNATEQLDIVDAYTLKADGRKIVVDPSAILTQQASDAQDNLMFDDQRRKVIIFPNVEVGDVVAYTARWTRKALIPGLVSIGANFDPTTQEANVEQVITVPKAMPLYVETHGVNVIRSEEGDNYVYRLQYANRRPLTKYRAYFDDYDVLPRFFASNFHDYQQFVAAYQPLIKPAVVVTPQVQALADKITAGITDRRQQTEAIYSWVSRHIRYVGIEFGVGGVVPHEADRILTNGYGDCKDHSVVFATLLKAKGIKAELVLINSGWHISLPVPPTIGNFDHMITYLPDFNLYADTTAEVAPFGTLPFAEYGKPVVHVPLDQATSDGPAVRRIPVLKPGEATITMKTTAHLQSDGKVVGDSETVATGPFSIDLRQGAMNIQADSPAQKAAKWLKDDGYDGTGSFDFLPPHDLASSYRLAGHFETDAYDGLLRGSQFELPRGLLDGAVPGSWLMGPVNFKGERDDPTYCWSGHEIEELSLELPAGVHLTKLPTGRRIEIDHVKFRSAWSTMGQTVFVRREFTSTIDVPVCLGSTRTRMANALRQIKNDLDTVISVTAN